MELIKDIFIYNKFLIFNFLGVYQDLKNYFEIVNGFKEMSKKDFWIVKSFRIDWIGMAYGVLSYDDSFFKELDYENQRRVIIRDMAVFFRELDTLNFNEILKYQQKRLKFQGEDTNSILVYFRPIFYFTSKWNVFNTLILIGLILNYFF